MKIITSVEARYEKRNSTVTWPRVVKILMSLQLNGELRKQW